MKVDECLSRFYTWQQFENICQLIAPSNPKVRLNVFFGTVNSHRTVIVRCLLVADSCLSRDLFKGQLPDQPKSNLDLRLERSIARMVACCWSMPTITFICQRNMLVYTLVERTQRRFRLTESVRAARLAYGTALQLLIVIPPATSPRLMPEVIRLSVNLAGLAKSDLNADTD